MDFDLSKDRKLIRASVKEFLEKECPTDKFREMYGDDKGYDPKLWHKMAELGWLGIPFPEEYGGTGGDFFDLVIVLEEMGRYVCPGPFFSTIVMGGLPVLKAGSEDQKRTILPKIANGEMILTMALTESSARYHASAIEVNASFDKGDYVLSGTKLFVCDAHIADYFLCVARTRAGLNPEEGITVFIVDAGVSGLMCNPLMTIALEKQNEVVFDHVRIPPEHTLGKVDEGWVIVKDTLEKAAVARCAEMIGGAQAVMEMTLQFAKKRVQFNRPIGGFQAVRQYLADMWVGINGCRHLVYKAAWKIAKGESAGKESAVAKAETGKIYRQVTTVAHQIFGAIGFTMEHDLHFYTRRAIEGALSFGDADFHMETIARESGL